jgi:hypothetical protein
MDKYILQKVNEIKEGLREFLSANPPSRLIHDKICHILDKIYEDGYEDGFNNR